MLKILFGFLAGVAMSAAVGALLIGPAISREKFDVGVATGYTDARMEIAKKIQKLLGDDFKRDEKRESFYDVKDASVVVVTRGHQGAADLQVDIIL